MLHLSQEAEREIKSCFFDTASILIKVIHKVLCVLFLQYFLKLFQLILQKSYHFALKILQGKQEKEPQNVPYIHVWSKPFIQSHLETKNPVKRETKVLISCYFKGLVHFQIKMS